MPDLPTQVVNYLQKHKRAKTTEYLAAHFKVPISIMLTALYKLRKEGCVTRSDGLWYLKLDC
jgi:predicted Rossmann fold nucleotide-binding protein DprA/Smf involved in DNA uptake